MYRVVNITPRHPRLFGRFFTVLLKGARPFQLRAGKSTIINEESYILNKPMITFSDNPGSWSKGQWLLAVNMDLESAEEVVYTEVPDAAVEAPEPITLEEEQDSEPVESEEEISEPIVPKEKAPADKEVIENPLLAELESIRTRQQLKDWVADKNINYTVDMNRLLRKSKGDISKIL